jgi:hypothetical protein
MSTTHETSSTYKRTGVKLLYYLSVGKLTLLLKHFLSYKQICSIFKTCFSQSSIFYESYYLCQQIKTVIA